MSGRPAPRLGTGLVLVAVAGVVLCALVVVGADADPLRAPTHEGLSTSAAIGDALFVAAVIGAALGLVVLVASFILLRPAGKPVAARKRRTITPILLAFLVALALLSFMRKPAPAPGRPVGSAGGAPPREGPPPASHVWRDAGWILVAVLGAAALGSAVVLQRHRALPFDRAAADVDDATIPGAVVEAVDAALNALEAAGDPRQTIIAAYARMLEALETRGLGCRPSETPRLHLARCLAAADVRPEPLERLVQLFEEARFGTHPMTWEDRDEARHALGAVRGDLVVGTS